MRQNPQMTTNKISTRVLAAGFLISCFWISADPSVMPFPKDYLKWTLVKSSPVGPNAPAFSAQPCVAPCTGAVHHFYANEKAVEGYRVGKFPDGAVIVDDLMETRAAGGSSTDGPRRSVSVMAKNSQLYSETGGWGFESFKGENQSDGARADAKAACHACHSKQKDRDFVYSELRK